MTTTSTSTVSGIEVSLSNQDQWEKFHPMTEMVVTRKTGRQLFPHLKYNLKGLKQNGMYGVFLHFERVDNLKYKFSVDKWEELGKGDEIKPLDVKQHKDGWKHGGHWMGNPVSFDYIKITNNPDSNKEHTVLIQSMHKYIPILTIQKMGDTEKEKFRLGVTEFIAVTAYQNNDIIALKKEMNKFASGFKETGGHNKSTSSDGSSPRGAKRQSTSPNVFPSPPPQSSAPIMNWTPPAYPYTPNVTVTPPFTPFTPMNFNTNPVATSSMVNPYNGYQNASIAENKENQMDQMRLYQMQMYQWPMPMRMYPAMGTGMVPSMGAELNQGMAPEMPPALQPNPMNVNMPMNNMGQWNMRSVNGMENQMSQSNTAEFQKYRF